MSKKKLKEQEDQERQPEENVEKSLKRKTIKEIIAPSGIDASNIDHLEIISGTKRYARSFFVSSLPRMAIFPEIFRDLYMFGDVNTSIFINPIKEERSQNELNRAINEIETERIVAADRGNINRESTLTQKRYEAEELRDQIAAGFNKLYEASVVSTLFAYSLEDLDRYTKMLTSEMSKNLVGIKTAWGMQEEAFKSNILLIEILWEPYFRLLLLKWDILLEFHLDLTNKQEHQSYLIISIVHLQIIIWLYLQNLVQVNLLL